MSSTGTTFQDRQQTRRDNELAVECTANLYGLPLGRLETRPNQVRIFTADIDDLGLWLDVMNGHVTTRPAGDDLTLWTLHTTTEPYADGTTVPVLVSVLLLNDEPVAHDITTAVAA